MARIAPTLVYVTYEGAPNSRFDQRYYVEHHLPLVMQAWQRYGLEEAAAFFPPSPRAGTLAICECRFRDAAAAAAAFVSPESTEVMADVANFTDIAPARLRLTPL